MDVMMKRVMLSRDILDEMDEFQEPNIFATWVLSAQNTVLLLTTFEVWGPRFEVMSADIVEGLIPTRETKADDLVKLAVMFLPRM